MPTYTADQLDDLEEQAEESRPRHQIPALAIVSGLLEQNSITHGVMGGMNFYLRGSRRETGDVDIAVDNPPRMDSLLSIFNGHPNVYRPANRMQWLSGVARLFVRIVEQDRNRHNVPYIVQVDLKPKGSEGNLIPTDLARAVETIVMPSAQRCQGLAIGPLVAAKIKAHYGRETADDYHDLRFVCTSTAFAPLVRQAAPGFRREWRECFLEKVLDNQPELERQVRWALCMERTPSPEGKGQNVDPRGGGGGGGAPPPSRDRSPKDGDRTSDKYWTYSARDKQWWHKHSDGKYSWTDRPSGGSGAAPAQQASSRAAAARSTPAASSRPRDAGKAHKSSSAALPIRSTAKTQPTLRNGDKSKDGYWTYNAGRHEWYHRHSDGKVSVQRA